MKNMRIAQISAIAFFVLLAAAVIAVKHAQTLGAPPSPDVITEIFSLEMSDPSTNSQASPADLLTQSGSILMPCEALGMLCSADASGALDDVKSISYGWDFWPSENLSIQFSVGRGSSGLVGTAIRVEANCPGYPEPHGDVFISDLSGANSQVLDGDGNACSTNTGYGLFILEGAPSDNIDSLERDTCRYPDLDCDATPQEVVYFTLAPGSPTLNVIGAQPADILVSGIDYAPMIWVDGAADLGLQSGDAVDALCLSENGDGFWGSEDKMLFSLSPGSPTLTSTGFSAAALLRPGPRVGIAPQQIGLQNSDDLDAAICEGAITILDIYLPIISKP